MLASLSDLQIKLIGAVVTEAKEPFDYIYVVPLGLGIAFTATQTIAYVNHAMKYYEQMLVMPIYQTNIMSWSIIAAMACLGETRYYTTAQLAGIALAIAVCILGILFLIQKTKDK